MTAEVLDRMLKEFSEVSERLTALRTFLLDEDKIKTVDNLNKDLMIAQLKSMESYLSILSVRIGLNAPKEEPAQEETPKSTIISE